MKLHGNTILITGGSSGIGLELAKVLAKDNTVLICGRSSEKLEVARSLIPSLHIFQCDLSKRSECDRLYQWVNKSFPQCNILINNAAVVHKTNFLTDEQIINKAELEVHTNYLGPVILTKLFMPILEDKENSKIIFITTGLVYAPKTAYPIYCSTKAALHSFVQTLRIQMATSNIQIIEVQMPATDTPFHEGNPPNIAIPVDKAVMEMMVGLDKGRAEIKVAGVKLLYRLSRIAPSFALKKINQT